MGSTYHDRPARDFTTVSFGDNPPKSPKIAWIGFFLKFRTVCCTATGTLWNHRKKNLKRLCCDFDLERLTEKLQQLQNSDDGNFKRIPLSNEVSNPFQSISAVYQSNNKKTQHHSRLLSNMLFQCLVICIQAPSVESIQKWKTKFASS